MNKTNNTHNKSRKDKKEIYDGQFKWKKESCKKGGKHEIDTMTNRCSKCKKHLQHSLACLMGQRCMCDLTKPLYNL